MKENRHETLREVFRFLNVDESFRSPRHDAIYHASKPHGLFRRTVERSRLARNIRPYVPPFDRLLGGDPRSEGEGGEAAIPRQRAAGGSLRLSPRGRRATPFPGGSGLRRVVDLTATSAVTSALPPDAPSGPQELGTRFRPRASRSVVAPLFKAAVISTSPQIFFEAGFPGMPAGKLGP